jgi:hypothetical protein
MCTFCALHNRPDALFFVGAFFEYGCTFTLYTSWGDSFSWLLMGVLSALVAISLPKKPLNVHL